MRNKIDLSPNYSKKSRKIKDIKFVKDQTSNEIVRRGLIEKIFGGVGTQQELPTTP